MHRCSLCQRSKSCKELSRAEASRASSAFLASKNSLCCSMSFLWYSSASLSEASGRRNHSEKDLFRLKTTLETYEP